MDGPADTYSAMGCKAVFSRHSLQEQRVLQTELVNRNARKCTLTLLVTDNLTMMPRYHVAPVGRGGQVSLRALFAFQAKSPTFPGSWDDVKADSVVQAVLPADATSAST